MEHTQLMELIKLVGVLIISAVTGVIGAAMKLSRCGTLTKEQFDKEKEIFYSNFAKKEDVSEIKSEVKEMRGELQALNNNSSKLTAQMGMILEYFKLMPKRKEDQ